MGHFSEVIKILKKDLDNKGLSQAAKDMNLSIANGVIELEMLNEHFQINESGIVRGGKKDGEVETLVILNAALCSGDDTVSSEWKPYEKFSGTKGHIDLYKKQVEGWLASKAEEIVANKKTIVEKYNAQVLDNIGGSDFAFIFEPFPNIKLFCQIYLADDEFPADAKLYFSANADKFMPLLCMEKLAHLWIKQLSDLIG